MPAPVPEEYTNLMKYAGWILPKAEKDSYIIGVIRPAGGGQNLFKINQTSCRMKKRFSSFLGDILE